jgi:hypothetical protein
MYDNFYGQSNINVSNPMNQTGQKQTDQKLTKKDIILYIMVPILVALIGAGVLFGGKGNNTPSPQPAPQQQVLQQATIPQLHGTYSSGSAINDGNPLALSLSGLTEQSDGTFTSSGTIGVCTINVSGNVSDTNIITFTGQQQPGFNCSQLTGDFTGKVTNNGSTLAGQWKVENVFPVEGGAWELS